MQILFQRTDWQIDILQGIAKRGHLYGLAIQLADAKDTARQGAPRTAAALMSALRARSADAVARMKHAYCSSIDQGGGKRRGEGMGR